MMRDAGVQSPWQHNAPRGGRLAEIGARKLSQRPWDLSQEQVTPAP